jgi:hypothetical protein
LKTGSGNHATFREKWSVAYQSLESKIEAVSLLCQEDGCLVFDKHLNLISFATVLDAPECYQLMSVEEFKTKGTRHRSAFNFCAKVKSRVMVISQDGSASFLWSEPKTGEADSTNGDFLVKWKMPVDVYLEFDDL